ncbi:MAG: DUF2635 domain-containing protein [Bradyrhizobium sp.]|uniref:DUF2635 domain-containing protein n=1 Tax=Bradyrhizobium sp. TaxID=376 RepID=UPI003BF206F6
MSNVFIKPALITIEGEEVIALVRDPESGEPLKTEGEWKPRSQFWARRIRDRDVIQAEPAAPAAEPVAEPVVDAVAAPAQFAPCAACVTADACTSAERCVKAPIA